MKILRELRKINGYTTIEVASILGFTKGTIEHYENGASKPDLETLIKISELYKVSTDYILKNDDNNIYISKEEYNEIKQLKNTLTKIINRQEIKQDKEYSGININGSVIGNNIIGNNNVFSNDKKK